MITQDNQSPKKVWKEPVLHQQGIETTASAAIVSDAETPSYQPGTPGS